MNDASVSLKLISPLATWVRKISRTFTRIDPLPFITCLDIPSDTCPIDLIRICPSIPLVLYQPLNSPLQLCLNWNWLFRLAKRLVAEILMSSPYKLPVYLV